MGILLDNFGVKSLRTNDRKRCMVVVAVLIEPVSNSIWEFCRKEAFRFDLGVNSTSEFNGFQPNSLRNVTGNLQTHNREHFAKNRKFNPRR